MMAHLKRAGVFKDIGGLILGEFIDVHDTGKPFGFSLEDIVLEALDGRDIPILMNAPFGHGPNNTPFALGARAELDTNIPGLKHS